MSFMISLLKRYFQIVRSEHILEPDSYTQHQIYLV
nr:MAG TPA: hypothetical protein [Caudoviricetes sp.]